MLPYPTLASDRRARRGGVYLALLFALALPAALIRGQDAPPPPDLSALPPLDQLLAPVALYPDPLIGLVLAASTDTAGLQAAAAYIAQGGDPAQIAAQPWSDGVKGLAHYPDVLKWMNDNLPWTQQLGAAFADQPAAVMGAIQDLRARARASGALSSTPQQMVVVEGSVVAIEPAQDEIYVPLYDPDLVYFAQPPGYWGGPFLTFGLGFPMGVWLGFDFDWYGRRLWAGNWYAWRRAHGGWGHPYNPNDRRFAGQARVWAPPPGPRVSFAVSTGRRFVAPRPMAGAPGRPAPRGGATYHPTPAPGQTRTIQSERTPRAEPGREPPHAEQRPEHPGPGGRPPAKKPAPKPPVKRPPPKAEEHKE